MGQCPCHLCWPLRWHNDSARSLFWPGQTQWRKTIHISKLVTCASSLSRVTCPLLSMIFVFHSGLHPPTDNWQNCFGKKWPWICVKFPHFQLHVIFSWLQASNQHSPHPHQSSTIPCQHQKQSVCVQIIFAIQFIHCHCHLVSESRWHPFLVITMCVLVTFVFCPVTEIDVLSDIQQEVVEFDLETSSPSIINHFVSTPKAICLCPNHFCHSVHPLSLSSCE